MTISDLFRGNMIGAHDLIIAATALHHGHQVLPTNLGEHERLPGLQVVRWTTA
jgi:predicted nucleic acid-binding protein